ncbi:MAG: amino acid permease [Patescibacteria group bacterium]|nr:amino acid permease [Patescibacteria group bacterium]
MTRNKALLALSTLVGTIIGAGIFGLPYVLSLAGVIPGLFYFFLLGGAVLLLHLMFGEITLRTKGSHRLIGYAGMYVGSWAKALVVFSTFVGVLGALLAYVIIGGEFIQTALSPFIYVSSVTASVIFWAVLSFFIIQGIQLITKMEFFMNIALFLVMGIIFLFAAPYLDSANFTAISVPNIILPFGVVLFALTGWSAIPEIADFFKQRKDRRSFKNIIIFASVITVILSAVFAFVVVGVSGVNTSEDALSGLVPFLGERVVALGALLGLIAVSASFLVLGNYLKNSMRYDFNIPYLFSAGVAVVVPISLFLLGFREFISVLSIAGIAIGVIEGIIIILIFKRAKKIGKRDPEYVINLPGLLLYPLIVILALGGLFAVLLSL